MYIIHGNTVDILVKPSQAIHEQAVRVNHLPFPSLSNIHTCNMSKPGSARSSRSLAFTFNKYFFNYCLLIISNLI